MKVLMLGWELPPHNSGGLGVACYQLCKALAQKTVDIEFVLPYDAEHQIDFMQVRATSQQDIMTFLQAGNAYASHGYETSVGRNHSPSNLSEQIALYERQIDHIATEAEFDIIHAHDWLTARAGIRAKQITGKPLIVHIHSIESDRSGGIGKGNPLVREIEYLAMLLADQVIAVSNHTKRAIVREYDIPADKIVVVHNSIDQDWYAPLTPDTDYRYIQTMKKLGYKVVVNIGRLTIQKGLYNFLCAAREVVARQPKTIFLIVGNGEQEVELLELSAKLGISRNVIFTGFARGKRLRDSFAIGDLFVMPSVSEPFGLTPLEAIGYGTPALISKQSGVAEVLQNCLKVDYWDVNEMANQICAVVANDSLRDELIKNALIEYQKLSWAESADKFVDIYQKQLELAVSA